jgi:transcriptional regulator with XRE-family HTH domain
MSMGEKIIHERKKKNWTAATLAKESHVRQSVIHYLEQGARQPDKVEVGTVKRLARTLGVTLDYLCGMYEDEAHGEA